MTTADIDIDAGTVLKAVRESVRILRENGRTTEERGWLAQENLELLDQAGVFRAAVPHRFGGLDLPLADQFALVAEIARGCGSTGWVANAWISSAWIISQYPDRAQEEIHAGNAGSLKVSGGFTPTGRATRTDDGFVLNGSWRFNTGIRGADWNILAALVERSDDVHAGRVPLAGRARPPSCAFTRVAEMPPRMPGAAGRQRAATAPNAARRPNTVPSSDPPGTPAIVAGVVPDSSTARARPSPAGRNQRGASRQSDRRELCVRERGNHTGWRTGS